MKTYRTFSKIFQCCLLFLLYSCFASPAHALNFNPIHHIRKATNWVAVKSGLKPAGDNLNAATTSAAQAAQQATETGKAAEAALKEITPKTNVALDSITRTSDAASTILLWIKWPLVVSVYCLALWSASLAVKGWRSISIEARPLTVPESSVSTPVTRSGRIILIALGATACFAALYMLYLDGTDMFRAQGGIPAYLIIGSLFSLSAGVVLCWFPVRRTWSCLTVGFISPIVALAALTYFTP